MEAPSAAVEKAKSEESTECGGFWHGTDVGIKSATGSGYLACKLVDDSSFTGLPTKVDINERLKVSAMGSHPFHTAAGDGYTRGHSSQWKVVCPGKSEGALHYGDSVALVKKVHSSLSIASSFAGAAADEAAGGSKATSVITVALCIDKEASVGAMALPVSAHGGLSKLKLPELCRWTIVCPDDLDSKEAVPLRSPRVLLRNRWGQYLSVADVTASSGHSSALYCRESSKRQECLWLIGRIDMILPSCGVLEDNDEEEEGPWPFVPLLPRPDFSTMSTEAQERLLILEILGAILGGRVSHITERSATHRRAPEEATNEGSSPWAVRRRLMLCGLGGCDISLQQVATQMLPLLEQLQFVKTFIKEHEGWGFGSVCEGLCEELNSLISDIYLRVAELRSKVEGSSEMTLSAVKLCLLSTSQELDLACRVLRKCWHKRGGAIVDSVYDQRTTVHDGALHLRLLSATVTPFLSLLYDWMLQGRLVSSPPVQQQEFLIVDTAPDLPCSSQEAEKFWNERFLIVTELTPFFINNTMERKILEAGRALRVLKTNTFLPTPPSEILKLCSLPGTPMDEAWRRSLAILVDKAQKWAVEQLYTFFIKSLDLKARLSSIHYHFLLCRSDWLSHFLDTAGDELEAQLVDSVDMNRINTLLELAIRSTASSTHTDPYCGEVVACMQTFLTEETPRKLASRSYTPYSIVQRSGDASRAPTGIRCFTLGLREVQWPLSLVLSTPAVFKLQVIFRHLCYCRWVQNRLSEVWLDFQSTKPFYSPGQDTEGLQAVFESSVLLCRMKQFVTNYIYYATTEVIQPKFESFLQMLEPSSCSPDSKAWYGSNQPTSLEAVMSSFQNLLDTLLKEMLLTSESVSLYKYLAKMLSTCSLYSKHMGSFTIGESGLGKNRDDISYYEASAVLGPLESTAGSTARESRLNATREHYINKVSAKHYKAMIEKFRDTFDSHLKGFLGALQSRTTERGSAGGTYVQNLTHRLDYNDFYTKRYGFDISENWGA